MARFRVGDRIYHPSFPSSIYLVDGVGTKEYKLTWNYGFSFLRFENDGQFRLCDEQTVDLILQKYGADAL